MSRGPTAALNRRADGIGCRHPGRAPELCACGSYPSRDRRNPAHALGAAAWELTTYACVYCGEDGEPFVTAAPDEERKDRRVEVCSSCSGYLKTVDVSEMSPFPLLSIGDLETMDLDMAAMDHGYAKPAMKDFARYRS